MIVKFISAVSLLVAVQCRVEKNPLQRNFIATDYLSDGEAEKRFFFNGIAAKETSAIYNSSDGQRHGAILRQMMDGNHLIQLVYDAGNQLLDCEFVADTEEMAKFLQSFVTDYRSLRSGETAFRNVTLKYIESDSDIPRDMSPLLHYRTLKKQCKKLHRNIRKQLRQKSKSSRAKRGLLMMPGTRWCGDGHRASQYSDLGAQQSVDRCCRMHDHCPLTILGGRTKLGFTNRRPVTISHCDCDERLY